MTLGVGSPEYGAFIDAVRNGPIQDVEGYLVVHPNFVDLPDNNGWTPLHYAASSGNDSTIQLLLRCGSTALDFPDNFGWCPLFYAAWYGCDSTMTILKVAGTTTLSFDLLTSQTQKLQAPIPEDEVLEIRFRIYFRRSLISRLLF